MEKKVIVLVGPTAVGKTAVALQIAKHLQTSIISADSRQCYREMNIGVAKPTPAELQAVPHYFINTHTIHLPVNASDFERYALDLSTGLFEDHDHVVVAGGTGLYIKAFCEGLDDIPSVAPALRQGLQQQYEALGMPWLKQQLTLHDPDFLQQTEEQNNPHRLLRALEVKLASGNSISSFRRRRQKHRAFSMLKLGLELPRPELYERINMRVDQMMADGLLEEVQALLPYKQLTPLNTVGYSELFEHLEGKTTLAAAVDRIKQNTRHYAKRQLTWFRRDEDIQWFSPEDASLMLQLIPGNRPPTV